MIHTELMLHQKEIVDFIKDKKQFALFADYGVGKSLCILQYIESNKDIINNVLIVAPKFLVLPGNSWSLEIKKHSDFEAIHLLGSTKEKKEMLKLESSIACNTHKRIFLINYDAISAVLAYRYMFDFIVFDESNYIKNPKAIRTKFATKMCRTILCRAIVAGYPITEHLQDIYSQIYLLDFGESLGKSFWEFNKRYFHKWRFGWTPNKNAKEKIIDQINHFIIAKKLEECIDLPKKITKNIAIDPSTEQVKMFEQIKTEYRLTVNNTSITMQFILQVMNKLHQICSGFFYKDIVDNKSHANRDAEVFQTPKDQILIETLTSIRPNACIIWCEFNYEIKKLHSLLKQHKIDCIHILSSDDRDVIKHKIKKFRKNKPVLIANPKFMGFGETFTEAKYMINYSHGWSYNKRSNAEARIYRKGAEVHDKIVYTNLYIKDSIEEKILKTLSRKKTIANLLRSYINSKGDI